MLGVQEVLGGMEERLVILGFFICDEIVLMDYNFELFYLKFKYLGKIV